MPFGTGPEMFWLHFSIVEGSRDASFIFFYSLWFELRQLIGHDILKSHKTIFVV